MFRSLFADIGDEQSIEASLSTFSAHITNIASMDRGAGDAGAGAARRSRLGHRSDRRRRARRRDRRSLPAAAARPSIATSHYDALKTYASTTEGVASAAFGFDAETFAPTYQLLYGIARAAAWRSKSPARLGLNPSVVAAARENLSAREAQLAEHLAKIDRDMRALEHEQRLAARERETLEAAEARMRQREDALRQREETFRRRLNEELETQVRQARREIDDVIAELKAKAARDRADAPRPWSRPARPARRAATRAPPSTPSRSALLEPARRRSRPPSSRSRQPRRAGAVGDRVIVGGLGLEGDRDGGARRHRGARRARQAHARQHARSARRRRRAAGRRRRSA